MSADLRSRNLSNPTIHVALVLRGRQFIRSWYESGLIESIRSAGIEVAVFADRETIDAMSSTEAEDVTPLSGVESTFLSRQRQIIQLHDLRKKSRSVRFKLERTFLSDYLIVRRNISLLRKLMELPRGLLRVFWSVARNFTFLFYYPKVVRHVVSRMLRLFDSGNLTLDVDFSGFDWVIIPSAGVGSEAALVRAARKSGSRSIVAIDNWDHLTAKGVFIDRPDYLTVMGDRDVHYAMHLHGFSREQVLIFGVPRFDIYRDRKTSLLSNNERHKRRVLYCGWSAPHSEARIVDGLAAHMTECFGADAIDLTYRPHPRRPRIKDPFEIVDKRVTVTQHEGTLRTDLPKMDRLFLDELTNADVVVGPPTTMMLEAAILNRPCVLDLTIDDFHRTSSGNCSHRYLHHQDLVDVPSILKAYNSNDLNMLVEQCVRERASSTSHPVDHLFDRTLPPFRELLVEFLKH